MPERWQASNISILVIEDDGLTRSLLEHEFQRKRYIVDCAGDLDTALRFLHAGNANYQLGIVDLRIPVSGEEGLSTTEAGLQAIEAARRAFPRMVIITMSSAFLSDGLRAQLTRLGVLENFSKPFSLVTLHEFVDSCIH